MNGETVKGGIVQGVVVSNKMDKTVVIRVGRRLKHPVYKKFITRFSKLHVHDPENKCTIGVIIVAGECRPISKTKSWKLLKVLEKVEQV